MCVPVSTPTLMLHGVIRSNQTLYVVAGGVVWPRCGRREGLGGISSWEAPGNAECQSGSLKENFWTSRHVLLIRKYNTRSLEALHRPRLLARGPLALLSFAPSGCSSHTSNANAHSLGGCRPYTVGACVLVVVKNRTNEPTDKEILRVGRIKSKASERSRCR